MLVFQCFPFYTIHVLNLFQFSILDKLDALAFKVINSFVTESLVALTNSSNFAKVKCQKMY